VEAWTSDDRVWMAARSPGHRAPEPGVIKSQILPFSGKRPPLCRMAMGYRPAATPSRPALEAEGRTARKAQKEVDLDVYGVMMVRIERK